MALQGSLREMSLANLIQVNCQEMRSARLTLRSRDQEGEIFLSDGQVVHAALGDLVGEEAIYAMISWDEGSFVLDLDMVPPTRSIKASWEDLLLQGMMQVPVRHTAEKQAKENMDSDVLTRLKAIDGVNGAVISASDGVVLGASVPEGDGENEAAVSVFIGSAADQLGQALHLDAFAHGVVSLKSKRILILEQPDRYVGLVLGENASAAIVANAATQVLKK
jgi:predicted regulator of Ras-like GTPase activity (Roadblock/LC7/MglB family)